MAVAYQHFYTSTEEVLLIMIYVNSALMLIIGISDYNNLSQTVEISSDTIPVNTLQALI